MKKQSIILLVLVGLFSSCFEDGDCTSTKTNLLNINFKNITTNKDTLTNLQSILLSDIDSIFHRQDTTANVTLPLNPSVDVMSIDFAIDTLAYNMTLNYVTTPHLISQDCGVELSFTDITISAHDFDSVVVNGTILDEQITTNVVIYQ